MLEFRNVCVVASAVAVCAAAGSPAFGDDRVPAAPISVAATCKERPEKPLPPRKPSPAEPTVLAKALEGGRPRLAGWGRVSVRPLAVTRPPGSGAVRSCPELDKLNARIDHLYSQIDDLSRRIADLVSDVLDGSDSVDSLWDLYEKQLDLIDDLDELLAIDVDAIDRTVSIEWKLPMAYLWSLRTRYFRIGNEHWNPWFGPDFTAVFQHTRELSAGVSLLPRAAASGKGLVPLLRYQFDTSWRAYCEEQQDRGIAFVEVDGEKWHWPTAAPGPRERPSDYALYIVPAPLRYPPTR